MIFCRGCTHIRYRDSVTKFIFGLLLLVLGDSVLANGSLNKACGSGDMIMASSFEPIPDFTITFISDANTVFTASGQQATFTVEYLDEKGQTLDTSMLEWCLEDGSLLNITQNGASATVSSTAFNITNVKLTVRDPRTSVHANATIMFADLQPEAIYINSDWVIDNGGGVGDVVLQRNPQTELIQPGDVLISGDKAGVLVRVLAVNMTADQVILTVEAARITDAFLNLNSSSSSSRQSMDVHYESGTKQLNMAIQSDNGEKSNVAAVIDQIECKQTNGLPFDLTMQGANIDWQLDIQLHGDIIITDGSVEEFYVYSEQTMTIVPNTGTLKIASQLSGKVTCELPLPKRESPTLPVSVFSFGVAVQPKVGIEISGDISGPSFSIAGPSGHLIDRTTSGIRYTSGAGWESIGSSSHTLTTSSFDASFNTDIVFKLEAFAYGGAGFQLTTNLGRGHFSWELAAVEFIELRGGVSLYGEMAIPFNPMSLDYTGPKWGLAGKITGEFKAELVDGAMADVLNWLHLPTVTLPVGGNIMDPIVEPFLSSPGLDFDLGGDLDPVSISCTHPKCYLDISLSDNAQFSLTTDGERNGKVTYYGVIDDFYEPILFELTSGALSNSKFSETWYPDSSFFSGTYRAHVRLVTDTLSQSLPYTLDLSTLPEMVVGTTHKLELMKVSLSDGQPVSYGKIVSEPAGLDCGDTCIERFPQFWDITLTAQSNEQYQFVRWAFDDQNGTCSGSANPECTIWLHSDFRPVAIFAPLTSVQIDLTGDGTGTVVSEPAGINCPAETCLAPLPTGTYLKLTATPDSGSKFYRWKDPVCWYANPCYVTLNDSSYVAEPIFTRRLADMTFADSALATCVQNAQKQGGGAADFGADIISLHCGDTGISDLTGIEQLTSMEALGLGRNSISNLAPLASMIQLNALDLRSNNITDISPLGNLINLKYLEIGDNQIASTSSLSPLIALEELWLYVNDVGDISGLANMTKIKVLNFYGNEVTNIDVLANMPDLNKLDLTHNQISDISVFSTFVPKSGALTTLDLSFNQITDVSPLRNWTELSVLNLYHNKVSHIGDLSNMDSLLWLGLQDNELVDVSGLAGLDSIETINLTTNNVSNLGDLSSLDTLLELRLGYNQLSDVSGLAGMDSLRLLRLDDSPLVNVTPLSGLTTLTSLSLWRTLVSDISSLTSLINLESLSLGQNDGRISCAQQASFPWVESLGVDGWHDANGSGSRDGDEDC